MHIRDYDLRDFDKIKALNAEGFAEPAPAWFILESIEAGHAWVAVEQDEVIGFLIGRPKFNVSYINNLVVTKAHQGKGIATSLISKFEEHFGKSQNIYSKVFWLQVESNNPAQKLYFDMGYRVSGIDENYYGLGRHALCMYKGTRPYLNM